MAPPETRKRSRKKRESSRRSGVIAHHLLPDGDLPGSARSENIWTGAEGPGPGTWADRRAKATGVFSWLLVGSLAVWLHLIDIDDFISAFPILLAVKVLIFIWVLFGVGILRPIFTRFSRNAPTPRKRSR